jgi:hypothetical protein
VPGLIFHKERANYFEGGAMVSHVGHQISGNSSTRGPERFNGTFQLLGMFGFDQWASAQSSRSVAAQIMNFCTSAIKGAARRRVSGDLGFGYGWR